MSRRGGRAVQVLPMLEKTARRYSEEDGAEAICMGSTTMHQAHAFLGDRLPVPIINPGPLTYKISKVFLALRLSHIQAAYPGAADVKSQVIKAMLTAAVSTETGTSGQTTCTPFMKHKKSSHQTGIVYCMGCHSACAFGADRRANQLTS